MNFHWLLDHISLEVYKGYNIDLISTSGFENLIHITELKFDPRTNLITQSSINSISVKYIRFSIQENFIVSRKVIFRIFERDIHAQKVTKPCFEITFYKSLFKPISML